MRREVCNIKEERLCAVRRDEIERVLRDEIRGVAGLDERLLIAPPVSSAGAVNPRVIITVAGVETDKLVESVRGRGKGRLSTQVPFTETTCDVTRATQKTRQGRHSW